MLGLLRTLHAWAGAILALILIVSGLTGALLAFKADYIRLALPEARAATTTDPLTLGRAVEAIEAVHGEHLHHVVFPGGGLGVHSLFLHDEGYGYADAAGRTVATWQGARRPEAFVYELHHFLLAGERGMKLVGVAGLAACVLALSGLVVWAPLWRSWRAKLWPRHARRGELLAAHRNLGALFALPVILFCLTGGAMIFNGKTHELLLRWFPGPEPETFFPPATAGDIDWPGALAAAQAQFPDARLRVAVWPQSDIGPVEVRLRQRGEWTQDGRTKVMIDPASGAVLGVVDAQALGRGYRLEHGLLPIHGAFVGGRAMDLFTGLSGLALAALGGFGLWSFVVKPRRRNGPTRA